MTYDPEVPSDSQVLLQDRPHIRFFLENLGKVFQPEYLHMADQSEENADEEENCGPVKPWTQLQCAGNGVTQVDVTKIRYLSGSCDVPPYFVGNLHSKTGEDKKRQQLHWSLQGKNIMLSKKGYIIPYNLGFDWLRKTPLTNISLKQWHLC